MTDSIDDSCVLRYMGEMVGLDAAARALAAAYLGVDAESIAAARKSLWLAARDDDGVDSFYASLHNN